MSNIEILAYEPSPLGTLCLRRRSLLSDPDTTVTEITLDGEFLMSSYHTLSERTLANSALKLHTGHDLGVLVGGLGLGYTAGEALRSHRVAQVQAVELLPQVVQWMQDDLTPLAGELKSDPRFTAVTDDVYRRLSLPPQEQYDLILIDVDHSPGDRLGTDNVSFYEAAGLRTARQHLLPDGILAVWSYAESSPFADALRQVFDEVHVEPVTELNVFTNETQTDWLFFARG